MSCEKKVLISFSSDDKIVDSNSPTSSGLIVNIEEDKSVHFLAPEAKDSDTLQKDQKYVITQNPKYGILDDKCFLNTEKRSNRDCIYQADKNFKGEDSLKFYIQDPSGNKSQEYLIKFNIGKITKSSNSNKYKNFEIVWLYNEKYNLEESNKIIHAQINNFFKYLTAQHKINFKMGILEAKNCLQNKNCLKKNEDSNTVDLTSRLWNEDKDKFLMNFYDTFHSNQAVSNNMSVNNIIEKFFVKESQWLGTKDTFTLFVYLNNEEDLDYKNLLDEIKKNKKDPSSVQFISLSSNTQNKNKNQYKLDSSFLNILAVKLESKFSLSSRDIAGKKQVSDE